MPKPTPGPRTPGTYGGAATPGTRSASSSNVRVSVVPPSGSASTCSRGKFPRRVASFVLTMLPRPSGAVEPDGFVVGPVGPVGVVVGPVGVVTGVTPPPPPSVIGGTRFVVEFSGIGKPVYSPSVKPVNDARSA